MKSIVVAFFASKLHGENYYYPIYEEMRKLIENEGKTTEFTPVITNENEARELAMKYSEFYPVIISLTGGTSSLIRRFVNEGNYNSVVLFGHGEHNSLPSVISARSKLDINGVWTWVFHCRNVDSMDCTLEVKRMMKITKAVASILNSKILLISPIEEKPEYIEDFEARFNSTVDVISMDKLVSYMNNAKKDLIDHFLETFDKVEFKVSRDRIIEVAKLYAVVKSLVEEGRYDAVAIDCFPYLVKYKVTPCLALALLNSESSIIACEGDLLSTVLMMISKSLTGVSGWIANSVLFEGVRAYFAHCTIALNMIKDPVVLSHFESGEPYSITGRLINNVYTIASLSPDYSVVMATAGRIIDSGLVFKHMCRTQSILDLGFRADKIPLVAASNHHVLIPGDVREELKAIAALLGLDYVEYSDAVSTL